MPPPAEAPAPSRAAVLREALARPAASAAFLGRAWAAIFLVEGSLRLLGYDRTRRWIERVPARCHRSRGRLPVPLGERLVGAAYRAHPLRGACLPRSLVQYLLHRRDGTPARFVLGVRRTAECVAGPRIEAHAWVEGAGACAPPAAKSFTPFFRSADPR